MLLNGVQIVPRPSKTSPRYGKEKGDASAKASPNKEFIPHD